MAQHLYRGIVGALLSATMVAGSLWTGVSPAQAAAPSNDRVANAVRISALPFSDARSTAEATNSASDGDCGAATVWYRYTPPAAGYVEVDTRGSDYDTMLALYRVDAGALTMLDCNDDHYGLQSRLVPRLQAGVTYYVSAGTCCSVREPGVPGPGGALQLNVETAPEPVSEVVVTVDRRGSVTRTGVVTLQGTITCDQPAQASIRVGLRQQFSRFTAAGRGHTTSACDVTPTRWSATVQSRTIVRLSAGQASSTYGAFASNSTGGAGTEGAQTVQLRRSK